ncbi:helix-turn-helix domain-containing protein [Sphingomonas jatrophae]|uniref:helix-turn-helix domain-containing protein n=1 Tax=Sphingomonas jatrophae TaxID=1166337 RepID=UPI0013F4C5CA|nr:AraC family transcriptional regulator [Sphingomonas jatrophae]
MIQTLPASGTSAAPPLWQVEALAEVATARIELRRYQLPRPSAMHELDPAPIFSAVEPRAGGARGIVRFEGAQPHPVGRLMLRPGGVPMHSRGDGGALTIMTCRFDPAFFARAVPQEDWDDARLRRCAAIESRGVGDAAARLLAELRTPGFAGALAIEALVQLLAVEIGRVFHPPAPQRVTGGLAGWQLRRIEARLADAAGDWPTTTELAALCGISRSHLSRAFAATTGTTLAAHGAALRIRQARALLTHTDLPLAAIAHRLGFATPSAFGAAFRRATGMTPAMLRRGGI